MPEFGSLRATSAATASGFITLNEELLPITHLIGAIFSRRSNLYRAIPRYYVDLRLTFWPHKPSAGAITIEGKVGTLLDPQAGMDPESTGIENIYLRGYMMGMSRQEIASKLDEIVEFTELGEFLQLPLRTYSAGMFARLAFAVSTSAQNDILLIDEGIGAGDAAFRKKAQERIESLFRRTPIVILASHSESLIAEFCNRRLQLEHGVLKDLS